MAAGDTEPSRDGEWSRPGERSCHHGQRGDRRSGFSLIELLVSTSIVVILVTLLTPAVSFCREVARRTQCQNRMRQLSVALHNYSHLHGVLPPGSVNSDGPIVMQEQGYHMNWLVQVLPFLDQEVCYQQIDFQHSVYADTNRPVRQRRLPELICPADSLASQLLPGSSYVGSTGGLDEPISEDNTGLLFLNSSIRFAEIRDGASYTILLGERLSSDSPMAVDLGWMSGTSATLRHSTMVVAGQNSPIPIAQQTGGFGAAHRSLHVALADGAVKAMNGGSAVWRELGCRDDGSMHPGF
ncbi:MAG: DUF1559 domain-containing protein [Planctomycetaceae bacterium]|nr:DUF1559 domain-containing protein [Planctomycetaceae bacterium]